MKKSLLKLISLIIFPLFSFGLTKSFTIKIPENVFEKNGNIYIEYSDKSSVRITDLKEDNSPQLSNDKKFIVFLRKIDLLNKPSEENLDARYPIQIIYYDIAFKSERVLAKSCYSVNQIADKYSTTTVEDEDKVLCSFTNPKISLDNKRVYFESFNGIGGSSGTTNYISLETNEIHYFAYGHLESIEKDGNLKLIIAKIEMKDGVSQGRQWKTWLYDQKGNPIKIIDSDAYGYNSPQLVTSVQLVNKFKMNERIANLLYLNKIVDISGLVVDLRKDRTGKYTITLKSNDSHSNVFATLMDKQISEGIINKYVVIRGTVTGFLSDVVINNATLIKVN